jgi:hypothetical protein
MFLLQCKASSDFEYRIHENLNFPLMQTQKLNFMCVCRAPFSKTHGKQPSLPCAEFKDTRQRLHWVIFLYNPQASRREKEKKRSLPCALGKNARQITIIVVRQAETQAKSAPFFLPHLLYHVPTDHT